MAQERKPKRQRFSLGGPSGDTSFEDYLTGNSRQVSSDEEEEDFDQENQDPQAVQDEEDEDEDFPDENQPPPRPANRPTTTGTSSTTSTTNHPVHKIHSSVNTVSSALAKNSYYHILIRLLLPEASIPRTRLLHLPATLLFEQLSQAISISLDWSGTLPWNFTLQKPPPKPLPVNAMPDSRQEIANIRHVEEEGVHNLSGARDHGKDLDSKKIRLMDVWGRQQGDEVKKSRVFFTYDPHGDNPWFHRITFLGFAEEGLMASDLGIELANKGQQVWCFGGTGAAMPEDVDFAGEWIKENNKYEWDVDLVNEELGFIEIKRG
ncbi:hypothetical protein E4T39_07823 [Aureobasidium subglaciale]|nr:hypothetical protein E4T39_07823 [Aureobasidium subglaciale]